MSLQKYIWCLDYDCLTETEHFSSEEELHKHMLSEHTEKYFKPIENTIFRSVSETFEKQNRTITRSLSEPCLEYNNITNNYNLNSYINPFKKIHITKPEYITINNNIYSHNFDISKYNIKSEYINSLTDSIHNSISNIKYMYPDTGDYYELVLE